MAKLSEADVRAMLQRRAREVAMTAGPLEAVVRRATRRRARNVVLASASTLALVALAAVSVNLIRSSDRGVGSPAGVGSATGGEAPQFAAGRQLRLVDYSLEPASAADHPQAGSGPTITVADLRRHANCMRSQGFDVPEPAKQPGGGWAVILDDAEARRLSFGSREFREAWSTCGPLGGPLSGDMIVGGPRSKIDQFMDCMSRQGFDLPEPRKDTSGSYDIDEWQFDLTRTPIDTSLPAWNRALFVTCAPGDV